MFLLATSNTDIAVETLNLIEQQLLTLDPLPCEIIQLADESLSLLAGVSSVAEEAVNLLETLIDLGQGCYNVDRAFDTLFRVRGMDETIDFAP